MAEIIKNPELRYTADNQMAVADMFVQFDPPPGNRPDDRHPTIEVIGWGNLATELKENYKQGDRIAIEGRLEMNTIEKDGYKEKRAKLVASRLYHVMATDATTPTPPMATATPSAPPASRPTTSSVPNNQPPNASGEDIDNNPV